MLKIKAVEELTKLMNEKLRQVMECQVTYIKIK